VSRKAKGEFGLRAKLDGIWLYVDFMMDLSILPVWLDEWNEPFFPLLDG
jgi:hypothetical protein